ncbi:YadA family autotransporter adhesin [Trinickia caryophylli]|nr:YadA family autotransporter adhesin [Trinickia caryophylli]WQE10364.1 YadA family autotransporter adhesin [Trinickia caryophylli]
MKQWERRKDFTFFNGQFCYLGFVQTMKTMQSGGMGVRFRCIPLALVLIKASVSVAATAPASEEAKIRHRHDKSFHMIGSRALLNAGEGRSDSFGGIYIGDESGIINTPEHVGPNHPSNGVAIGTRAKIGTNAAVAIGRDAVVTGDEAIALGREAKAESDLSVALGAGSRTVASNSVALGPDSFADRANTVSVGSAKLQRQITNVAPGTADTDAVNLGQLKAAGLDTANALRDVVFYDSGKNHSTVTLGGVGAVSQVSLTNVAAGRIGANSTDAVNGSQLFSLTGRVEKLEKRSPRRDESPHDERPVVTPDKPIAKGLDGGRMRVTNVVDGVQNTDAANVGQLNAAVEDNLRKAKSYTDEQVGKLQSKIDTDRKDAFGGTASAIAIANLPQAYPGESMISVAGGTFEGQSAAAIGVSTSTSKWSVKGSFAANSRGSYGGGVGAGYRF